MFYLMENYDDDEEEEEEEEVTLSNIKQDMHTYFVMKLRNVVVILIEYITMSTTEKDFMNNIVHIFL